jgi:sporulation protein YunB
MKPFNYWFIVFSLLIFMALSIQTFIYIEKRLEPALMQIAQTEVHSIATKAINEAITKKIVNRADFRDLLLFQKDANGKIVAVMFNSGLQTRVIGEATEEAHHALEQYAEITRTVPLGQVLNSNILAQIGPDIEITFEPVGAVHSTLETKLENAGINMVLATVILKIQAQVTIVIPFKTDTAKVETAIPLSHVMIVGDVPTFYYDGSGNYVGSYPGASQHAPPVPQIIPPLEIKAK